MRNLTSHLSAGSSHGRHAFDPACPACRETRLLGSVPSTPLLSRRAQAVMAAAVLAVTPLSAVASARADDPDSEEVGTQDPDQTPPDPADDPNYRPPSGPVGPDQDAGPIVGTDAPTDDAELDPLDAGTPHRNFPLPWRGLRRLSRLRRQPSLRPLHPCQ